MMKQTSLFLLSLSSIILLAGCVQQQTTPLPSPTPTPVEETTQVSLYYHNLTEDQNVYEWISFNEEFFLPIERTLPASETLIADTFTLLLNPEFTAEELSKWFYTGIFETHDFSIQTISFDEGVLTITFVDDSFLMSLASAEQAVLGNSLIKTAQQFPEIERIVLHEEMMLDVQ